MNLTTSMKIEKNMKLRNKTDKFFFTFFLILEILQNDYEFLSTDINRPVGKINFLRNF